MFHFNLYQMRILLLFLILPIYVKAQNAYLLMATYEKKLPGVTWICQDQVLIQESFSDINSYEIRKKELYQQYKDKNISFKLITPGESVMVFQYDKAISGWNCTKNVISIRTGKDLIACQQQIDNDVKKWPNDYKTIPKAIFQRDATVQNGKVIAKQNWDGLDIEFTSVTLRSGEQFVVVRAKNTLSDKTAMIGTFLILNSNQEINNKPTQEHRLDPGQSISFQLRPAADYKLGLQLIENSKTGKSFSVIQWVKEHVRAQVTKKGSVNENKGRNAVLGVRG